MTHSPPVPPGNQSPYPIEAAPPPRPAPLPAGVTVARTPDASGSDGSTKGVLIGLALGALALAAGVLLAGRRRD